MYFCYKQLETFVSILVSNVYNKKGHSYENSDKEMKTYNKVWCNTSYIGATNYCIKGWDLVLKKINGDIVAKW